MQNWWLKLGVPAELDRYLVFKGSIAIDGISLTIRFTRTRRAWRDYHPAHVSDDFARQVTTGATV